ncbi:hypothetical protein KR026_008360, partial [Drosophila bipectinata]
EAVIFKMTNAVCVSYNQSWIKVDLCRLKAVGRDKVVFNMQQTVLHPVNSVQVHGSVLQKASGFKPWIVNAKLDICRYLERKNNPIARIVQSFFAEFSNLNHTCPYVGPLIIKDFYLRPELLKLPWPTGEYMLSLKWFYYNRHQSDLNVSFVFVEDLRKG